MAEPGMDPEKTAVAVPDARWLRIACPAMQLSTQPIAARFTAATSEWLTALWMRASSRSSGTHRDTAVLFWIVEIRSAVVRFVLLFFR